MKPAAPLRYNFGVFATDPARGFISFSLGAQPVAILHSGPISFRLADYPVCLGPLPKRRKLWRRSLPPRELFPMVHQHFREIHSVRGDALRIRAAFEQMERVCVGAAVTIKPH